MDKKLFAQIGPQSLLNDYEHYLAQRAMADAEGKMSIPLLIEWGVPERKARTLVEAWELRGWLHQDPTRQNARYITTKFQEILSNCQAGQTGSNLSS